MDEVFRSLYQFEHLGKAILANGSVLIGKAPHIAPMAWLHRIFNPLTFADIKELQSDMGFQIPLSYQKFLQLSNGLGVFNTTLSLYGLRNNYKRTVDGSAEQPFDIVTPNTYKRMANATDNIFIIGSYSYDGSRLYIDNIHKVYMCDRYDTKPLFEWNSFEVMLSTEINRLITLFDANGKKKASTESTLPV